MGHEAEGIPDTGDRDREPGCGYGGPRAWTLTVSPRRPRRLSFWLGVILVALSFGIYPAYPIVAFLPISWWSKGGVAVGLLAVSWGMFCVGSVLVGKKGLAYLKRRMSSRRG